MRIASPCTVAFSATNNNTNSKGVLRKYPLVLPKTATSAFCLFLLLTFFSSTPVTTAAATTEIKLAHFGPGGARAMIWGARAAFYESAKTGGLHQDTGHNYTVSVQRIYQTGTNSVKNRIQNDLLADEDIFGMLLNFGTSANRGMLQGIGDAEFPSFGPFTGNRELRDPFCKQCIHTRVGQDDELVAMLSFLLNSRSLKRVCIWYREDNMGRPAYELGIETLRTIGMEWTLTRSYQQARTINYTQTALDFVEARCQGLILFTPHGRQSTRLMVTFRNQTLFPDQGKTPQVVVPSRLLRDLPIWANRDYGNRSILDGALGTANLPHGESSSPVAVKFRAALADYQLNGLNNTGTPNFGTEEIEGYVAGRLVLEAIKKAEVPLIRKRLFDSIYQNKMFQIDDLTLGPYSLDCPAQYADRTGLERSSLCNCSQGLRFVKWERYQSGFREAEDLAKEQLSYALGDCQAVPANVMRVPKLYGFIYDNSSNRNMNIYNEIRRGVLSVNKNQQLLEVEFAHHSETGAETDEINGTSTATTKSVLEIANENADQRGLSAFLTTQLPLLSGNSSRINNQLALPFRSPAQIAGPFQRAEIHLLPTLEQQIFAMVNAAFSNARSEIFLLSKSSPATLLLDDEQLLETLVRETAITFGISITIVQHPSQSSLGGGVERRWTSEILEATVPTSCSSAAVAGGTSSKTGCAVIVLGISEDEELDDILNNYVALASPELHFYIPFEDAASHWTVLERFNETSYNQSFQLQLQQQQELDWASMSSSHSSAVHGSSGVAIPHSATTDSSSESGATSTSSDEGDQSPPPLFTNASRVYFTSLFDWLDETTEMNRVLKSADSLHPLGAVGYIHERALDKLLSSTPFRGPEQVLDAWYFQSVISFDTFAFGPFEDSCVGKSDSAEANTCLSNVGSRQVEVFSLARFGVNTSRASSPTLSQSYQSHILPQIPLPPPPGPLLTPTTVALIVILVLLLAIVGCSLFIYVWQKGAASRAAPRDENASTIILVSVKQLPELWDSFPEEMDRVLRDFTKIVRNCVNRTNVYEVKRVGEGAFMIAAKTPELALNFAARAQKILVRHNWKLEESLEESAFLNSRTSRAQSLVRSQQSSRIYSRSNRQQNGEHGANDDSDTSDLRSSYSHRTTASVMSSIHGQDGETVSFACSIGIQSGKVRIMHDEVRDSFDYSGVTVQEAAKLADLADDWQILCGEDVFDAISSSKTEHYYLENFCSHNFEQNSGDDDGGEGEINSEGQTTIYMLRGKGLPVNKRTPSQRRAAAKSTAESPSGGQGMGGGVSTLKGGSSTLAALDEQTTGLCQKRVTVLWIKLYGLNLNINTGTKGKVTEVYTKLHEILDEVVPSSKGHLHSVSNSTYVLTWNATCNVANQLKRAVLAFLDLKEAVKDNLPRGVQLCAGLTSGYSLVGHLGTGDTKVKIVASGVMNQAEALSSMCRLYPGVSLLTTASLQDDLQTCAVLQAVDFVQLPSVESNIDHLSSVNTTTERTLEFSSSQEALADAMNAPSSGSNHLRLQQKTLSLPATLILGVMGSADESGPMDEWMYELENADGANPYKLTNSIFRALLSNNLKKAKEIIEQREELQEGNKQEEGRQNNTTAPTVNDSEKASFTPISPVGREDQTAFKSIEKILRYLRSAFPNSEEDNNTTLENHNNQKMWGYASSFGTYYEMGFLQ